MKPFIVMEVLERALEIEARGQRVIHLEIGEPDASPPAEVGQAAIAAVEQDLTNYTQSFGIRELRQALSAYYLERYQAEVPYERIFVTTGTSAGFLLAFGCAFKRGDTVAIADPGYPCYANILEFLGLNVLRIPVRAEEGFRLTGEAFDRAAARHRIDGVIDTSPANPTGAITPRETLRYISEKVKWLIADEIYHWIYIKDNVEKKTACGLNDNVIVIDGFSKRYAMTGYRLGWMVLPEALFREAVILGQNVYICAPSLAQYAGLAALKHGDRHIDEMEATFRQRAEFLIGELKDMGFTVPAYPEGAFYVYAGVGRFTEDAYKFCFEILEKAHVGITPGADFGLYDSHRYIRFSLANSLENIQSGVERLRTFLA